MQEFIPEISTKVNQQASEHWIVYTVESDDLRVLVNGTHQRLEDAKAHIYDILEEYANDLDPTAYTFSIVGVGSAPPPS